MCFVALDEVRDEQEGQQQGCVCGVVGRSLLKDVIIAYVCESGVDSVSI